MCPRKHRHRRRSNREEEIRRARRAREHDQREHDHRAHGLEVQLHREWATKPDATEVAATIDTEPNIEDAEEVKQRSGRTDTAYSTAVFSKPSPSEDDVA